MLYEVMCIAMAIYWEARGESLEGQFAVGQVVMNRVRDPRYPSDACSVVYDAHYYTWDPQLPVRNQCQFSFYCDGKSDQPQDHVPWRVAQLVAAAVYEQRADPIVGDATHYHALRVQPHWAVGGEVVARIQDHVFYTGVQ